MPELTDSQRMVLNNATSNLEVSAQIKDLPTNSPGEYADKWRFASTQVDALLEMRTRVATLPTDGSHAEELAETLASLDHEITGTLGALRELSAYSGVTNDEKIEQLKTIQSLAGRHAVMGVTPEARQTAMTINSDLQSEIFTRQSPGFQDLVLAPEHADYETNLESAELAIQARRNMGQMILVDARSVLSREPEEGTISNVKEKTIELRSRNLQLSSTMDPVALQKAQEEMNRIRMGTSDTIQGKSGGGEREGGASQATRNWLEASQRATEFAQSGQPISLEQIQELNKILNKNMPANDGVAGQFRAKTETAGGGSQYPYPEHIPQMMQEFTKWFAENQHRDPIELAGLSYQKLVSIHPFDDANGRTCRLVVDSILQSKGLPPASYEGTEVNLAVFGVPQGGKKNLTPDEAIQIVGRAVERSVGVMEKHSVQVSVREELKKEKEKEVRIESGHDLPSPQLQVEDGPSPQQQKQGVDENPVPDVQPAPLTLEQQQTVERLRQELALVGRTIQESTAELNKPNPLTQMATGGVKPDLSKFSQEELGVIYDQLVRAPALNQLSDGYAPITNKWVGDPHRNCPMSIADRGILTKDLSREELVEGIDDVLQHYNYDLDPMLIAEAQNMTTNGRSAEIDGRMVNVILGIEKLEEAAKRTVGELQDVKDGLPQARLDAKAFAKFTEQKMAANVQTGMRTKLEQFAARGGVKAEEAQEFFESSRRRMDPSGMAGGNLHVAKMEKIEVDLTGMKFKGTDLSKSDLSGFKIDAHTLSQAKGLNTVQGVGKDTLDLARHFQRIDRLEARLDKLSQPSFLDRLKSISDGGVDRAREKIIARIDQVKIDFQHSLDLKGGVQLPTNGHENVKPPKEENSSLGQSQSQSQESQPTKTVKEGVPPLEKRVSVRESLGRSVGEESQSQKTTVKVQ